MSGLAGVVNISIGAGRQPALMSGAGAGCCPESAALAGDFMQTSAQ
jgi:hypothetical protein